MDKLKGASKLTHALKEYGGKSMADGIKRIATEQRQQGFQQGVKYALCKMSILERLVGHPIKW
ncbi:MAG: hypothetical protein ACI4ME_03570 [Aristaeellaceae bacterium]